MYTNLHIIHTIHTNVYCYIFFAFLFICLPKFDLGCLLWAAFQVTESNFPCSGSQMSGIWGGGRIVFQMDLLFLKEKIEKLKSIRKAE